MAATRRRSPWLTYTTRDRLPHTAIGSLRVAGLRELLGFVLMSPVLALLWLSSEPPSAPERATLDAWARANDVALVEPHAAAPSARYDARVALSAEQMLERARKAISTLDPSAQASLDELALLLAAHPELPQAAWLEAERQLLLAELVQRTTHDAARVAALRDAARALEGSRADTFDAEPVSASAGASQTQPLPELPLRRGDVLYVDGRRARPDEHFSAGRHQLQIQRADVLVLATWSELGAERGPATIAPAAACSRTDLAGSEGGVNAPSPDAAVSCPRWVAARTAPGGAVQVALCEAARCDGWSLLTTSTPLAVFDAHAAERDSSSWLASPWVTWGAAFTGVAVVTSLVLWQTGAFDTRERAPEFVFTGPSAAAFSF